MVDRRVEVGVVADARGQGVLDFGLRRPGRRARPCHVLRRASRRSSAQERRGAAPASAGAHREEIVQRRGCAQARAASSAAPSSMPAGGQRREVEHLVADGHAAAKRLGGCRCGGTPQTAGSGSGSRCLRRSPPSTQLRAPASCVWLSSIMAVVFIRSDRRHQRVVEDRHRARPAGRGAADLVRKAADDEAVGRQRFEVVQLLEVAVADVAAGLVAFPDQRGVLASRRTSSRCGRRARPSSRRRCR